MPPRTTRSADEILADARAACSEDVEASQIEYLMCGYLARQVEILERGLDVMERLDRLNNELK